MDSQASIAGPLERMAQVNEPTLEAIRNAVPRASEAFLRLNGLVAVPSDTKGRKRVQITHAYKLPTPEQAHPGNLSPHSESQCTLWDAALGEGEGKKGYAGRVLVRITSFRRRLIDPDNLCPKYFVDCLRYAGILRDDRAANIELVTAQEKVGRKEEERTQIEIERVK